MDKLRPKPRHGFGEVVGEGLETAPVVLGGALIPDVQSPGVGGDGGPDILAGQAPVHRPGFVEQSNRPSGGHWA